MRRGGPAEFAVRRLFRLYPTLWFCLLASVAAIAVYSHRFGQPYPYNTADLVTNATLISGYTGNKFISWGLWTLAIEEVFYVTAAFLAWRRLLDRPIALLTTGAALTTLAIGLGRGFHAGDGKHFLHYWVPLDAIFVVFILVGVALHHLYYQRWDTRTTIVVSAFLFAAFILGVKLSALQGARGYVENAGLALAIFVTLFLSDRRLHYSPY